MPRFSYIKQKENIAPHSSSCPSDSNADVVVNDTDADKRSVIGGLSRDRRNENIIESGVDKRLDSILGIEEDYFTSEFSFDYDNNSDPFNCATAVIWSGSNDEPARRTVSPKTTPGDSPMLTSTHPKDSPSTTTPTSSRGYLTTDKKRNRVSFDNDVNFRQKSSRRLKKTRKDDKKDVIPTISTAGAPKTLSTHDMSSNQHCTYSTQSTMPFQDMPSQTNNKTNSHQRDTAKLHISPRVLAIDTRVVQTFHGDAVGNTFRDFIISFLHSCSEQGLLPKTISTTVEKESKTKYKASIATTPIGTRTTHLLYDVENHVICKFDSGSGEKSSMKLESDWNELLPRVYIRAPSNMNNTKNRSSVHAPKRLLAADSWRILGDLVEGTVNQSALMCDKNTRDTCNRIDPIDVSIITNDVALFTDKNVDSHKRAATRFLDRMKQKFEEKLIRSIQIIVLQTGIDALDPNRANLSTNRNIDDGTSIGSPNTDSDPDQYIKEPNLNNRFQVACIAKVLKVHISSQLAKDPNRKKDGSPMDIIFEFKDLHRLHLNSILREWTRSIIYSPALTGRVSFDLPESLDGTQCSIALDVWYSIFPYSANSCHVQGLVENIRLLNNSVFEIIQLVPLDKVDLSLIYGVPLVAKAALDGDLDQYHEMQKIFSSLLKYLASGDVALVLGCISGRECNMSIAGKLAETRQIFLLMPQISEESNTAVLNKGMMYQYLSKGFQIIDDCKGTEELESSVDDEYAEVIQNSLDLLDKTVFNPCKYSNTSSFSDEMLQGK